MSLREPENNGPNKANNNEANKFNGNEPPDGN